MKLRFTLPVTPRTKKTHNQAFILGMKQKLESLNGPASYGSGQVREMLEGLRPVVFPSKQYEEFFAACKPFLNTIRSQFEKQNIEMPLQCNVSVMALFYRDRDAGDFAGYIQALGDILQWREKQVHKNLPAKLHWRGIIVDDVQIQHWDGTRLLVDRERPRIEVTIETIEEQQAQLFNAAPRIAEKEW